MKKQSFTLHFKYILGICFVLALVVLIYMYANQIASTRLFLYLKNTLTATFFFNFFLYFFIPLFVTTIIVLILVIRYYTKKGIRVEAKTVEIERKVDEFLVKLIFTKNFSTEFISFEIENFKKTIPFNEKYVKKIVLTKIFNKKEAFNLKENDI